MYFFFEIYTLKNVNHFFGFLICLTFFSNFLADFFYGFNHSGFVFFFAQVKNFAQSDLSRFVRFICLKDGNYALRFRK